MNFPTITFDWIGNGTIIAIIAVLHVVVNHAFAIGGSILMVSTEYKAYKTRNQQMDDFARKLSKLILIVTTTTGAMTGVGIWFSTMVIQPNAIGSLLRIYHWAWFTEWIVFVSEVILLLVYFYTWKKWSTRKKKWLHIKVGIGLSIASWLTMAIITAILGAQLTPGEWVETRSFWDGVANPTWLPQLFFRSFAAIVLAVTILGPYMKFFVKDEDTRRDIRKLWGKWAAYSVPFMLALGIWYLNAVPQEAKDLILWSTGFSETTFKTINLTALGLVVILAALYIWGKKVPFILTTVVALMSVFMVGEFEIVRETIRKPYVIYHYMYVNGIRVDQVEKFQEEGYLANSNWSSVNEVTEDNKLEAGREIFEGQCMACHTVDGWRDKRAMAERIGGWNKDALSQYIATLHQARSFMPPFAGTEEEREALAEYLVNAVEQNSSAQALKEVK